MNTVPHHASNDNTPLKRCPSCPDPEENKWHPATPEYFHHDKGSKDGFTSWCKVCTSQRAKEYGQRPEVFNRRKAYREQHKEKISQRDKARYAASREQMCEHQKTLYQINREKNRLWRIEKLYGLAPGKWDTLFEQQNGQCAICGTKFDLNKSKSVSVDHCHKTGAVRGLLCTKCNVGLGAFDDNSEMLLKAIQYLERAEL